jgi:adenylylsulfate kinase
LTGGENKEAKGQVVWLMGPTSSGKTTLGRAFVQRLRRRGFGAVHYDGDEVRGFFGPDHGFAADDRLRVVRTLVHLANKAAGAGLHVVVSALTATPRARAYVNEKTTNLIFGHVNCPVEVCARRDPKGLYKKAARGEIDSLIGFNTPYLAPENPDIVVDTDSWTLGQGVDFLEASVLPRVTGGECRSSGGRFVVMAPLAAGMG